MNSAVRQFAPHHAEFTIERRLGAPPALAFSGFSKLEHKTKWFGCDDTGQAEHTLDFRVGGKEIWRGALHGHPEHRNDTVYFDIIENQRIVYGYALSVAGRRISVSLTTITFASDGGGTLLRFHEQGVFFDGAHDADERAHGTAIGLDLYAEALTRLAV